MLFFDRFFVNFNKIIIFRNIFVKMTAENSQFLYRSAVGSSIALEKSPVKLWNHDPRADEHYLMQRSAYTPYERQWTPSDYSGIKKIPESRQFLRQTYEIGHKNKTPGLTKASSYTPEFSSNYPDFSRSQYNLKTSSPKAYDLTSSVALDRNYKKEGNNNYDSKAGKNVGGSSVDPKIDFKQKIRFYTDTVEKFKQQEEATSKMSEQLRQLKESRQKRLEAQEKQKQVATFRDNKDYKQYEREKQKQKQAFKKKISYDYQKQRDLVKVEKVEKSPSTSSNTAALLLEKYKTTYNSTTQPSIKEQIKKKTSSKYQQYIESKPITSVTSSSNLSSLTKTKLETVSLYNGQIKDFVLGKMLGEGKFGTVFQAFHKPTRSLYAIKKIPKDMIKSHLMIDQFCLQVKLQMFLNHENILTLFNFFDDRTHIYLVLEYMQQGTLFTHLKKNKKLPQAEVAIKIKQVASAIKYLHQNQIAHRDIKPQNIVMSHGVCKLCDFGWATVCDERRKTYCGTFDYAPPEILAGAQYDYTVDLWCLGVLTYELLVGKAPFYHISRKQTMKKILNVEKTVIEYPEGMSKEAMSFIENLIKKNPKQRISSQQILEHPFIKYAVTRPKYDLKKSI